MPTSAQLKQWIKRSGEKLKKIYWTLWIIITFCACCFSGCVQRTSENGKIILRYENWEIYPAQIAAHQRVVDEFNKKHKDIEVKFEPVQGGPEKIIVEMAGGAAPDIFFWGEPTVFVEKGAVVNLKPYMDADQGFDLKIYFPRLIKEVTYGEGIYALPVYFGSEALIYNKDLFDKAGINYPNEDWTWDDYLEAAKKLTIRNNGKVVQFGTAKPYHESIIKSFGADYFSPDGKEFLLDSQGAREALQFLVDLHHKYNVVPTLTELEGPQKMKSEVQLFMAGKVGMFPAGSFLLATLRDIKDFSWDVSPIPYRKGRKRVTGFATGCLCVSAQSKNPKAAWEFVKFATGKEGAAILGTMRNCVPPIPEVARNIFAVPPPEHINVYVDAIEYGAPRLRIDWLDEFNNTVLAPEIDLLYLQKKSVEETIQSIKKGAQKYIGKP